MHVEENYFKDNCDNCTLEKRKECDGSPISNSSACCKNNDYIRCPHNETCKDANNLGKFRKLVFNISLTLNLVNFLYFDNSMIIYKFFVETIAAVACSQDRPSVITMHNNTDITSLNFPEKYNSSSNCSWHILADIDHNLQLEFRLLDTEEMYV